MTQKMDCLGDLRFRLAKLHPLDALFACCAAHGRRVEPIQYPKLHLAYPENVREGLGDGNDGYDERLSLGKKLLIVY